MSAIEVVAYAAVCIDTNTIPTASPRRNANAAIVDRDVFSPAVANRQVTAAVAAVPTTISRRGPTTRYSRLPNRFDTRNTPIACGDWASPLWNAL